MSSGSEILYGFGRERKHRVGSSVIIVEPGAEKRESVETPKWRPRIGILSSLYLMLEPPLFVEASS